MKCPRCGSEQTKSFCTVCGTPLHNQNDISATDNNLSTQTDSQKRQKIKNPYAIWAFVLSIFTLLLCAAPTLVVLVFGAGTITLIVFSFKKILSFGLRKGLTIAAIVITTIGLLFGFIIPKADSSETAVESVQAQVKESTINKTNETTPLPATSSAQSATYSPTIAPTSTPTLAPSPSPTVAPTATPEIAIEIASPDLSGISSASNQDIVDLLNLTLEDGDGYSYEVSYVAEGNFFLITMIVDGATITGLSAQKGSSASIAAWNDFVETVCTLNDSIVDAVSNLGSDALVSIMVLNEYNTDNVILTTLNSVVVSNILTDEP